MIKKVLCLSLCFACFSGQAVASYGNNTNGVEDFSFEHQELDMKKSSYEDIQGYLSSYGSAMSEVSGVDEYKTVEKGYLKLIYSVFPNLKSYWGDVYTYDGTTVVHADSLIDLERMKVDKVNLGARMHDFSSQYSVRESDGAEYPVLKTSHFRMKSGFAPIGPDNEPLLLCRLHDDPRASYFEMAQSDAWRLLNAVGSGMTVTQACMSEKVIPGYWKDRIDTLIDGRGNITKSKRHLYGN